MNLSLTQFFPLLSMIFILGLGVIVLSKNKTAILNRLFFLISLVFAIWQFGTFMMFINTDDQKIIFWDRFIYLGVVFMPALQYHFSLVFTYFNYKRKKLLIIAYIFSFIFLLLSRTNYFVADIFRYRWGVHTEAKILHHFFLVFFFFYIFALLYNFLIQYKKNNIKAEKYKLIYLITSFSILNLIGGLGYLPAYKISIYSPISLIAPLIFSILMTYAIVVHHLMDIKIVLRRYSVFLGSLSFILILATAVKYFVARFFYNYSIWADPVILIIALFIYPIVKNYFYRIANRYFFSSLYDSNEVIANVSDKLRSTLDINNVYKFIADILTKAFHTKAIGVFVYDNKNADYIIQYNRGFNIAENSRFVSDEKTRDAFIARNKALIVDEVLFGNYPTGFSNNKTVKLLSKLGVEILMPLNIEDKAIGLIILGKKESGDMYNDDDLQVLKVAGAQIAISMENGLLYQETKNFNIKLEKEVEKATYDLRKANEQLKKLDTAKSEFISIASHQLRTPLTIIKDYVSMILEGNFGKLTDMTKQSLEKVFQSNERLIQLVEDLLNISRIESGRLQFNFIKADLGKITANVIDELSVYSKKKNLLLKYKQSAIALPLIKIDEGKIRQVIMNLIDNAIKYTKQGKIAVEIKLVNKQIRFCVTDSGMGIKQEYIINLFKKFFRGKGTSLINTEGMGLGLYVARIIIEQHHGKIWAESNGEGKGSKFCFELPTGE